MKDLPFLLVLLFLSLGSHCQLFLSKSIKDFGAKGDGRTNDHEAFKNAAKFFSDRKGNGKLIIPKGIYVVGKQVKGANGAAWLGEDVLSFKGCKNFAIEGKNASIKLQASMRVGAFDPKNGQPHPTEAPQFTEYGYLAAPGNVILFTECEGISISSLRLEGNNQNFIKGGKFGDHGFQVPGDGIEIINSKDIVIDRVEADYFVRDGLQIINKTPQEWKTASQNIKLKNCSFAFNGRQGFSWVGGVGLEAIKCKFNHTGRGGITSAPAAGVDIEAEVGIIRDGTFIDCEFINNNGCGFVADSGPSRDVRFLNCTFWGVSNWSMWTTKANYSFNSCSFYGSVVQGYDSPNDADATKFINCTFEDKPYNGVRPYGLYLVEINGKKRMLFDSCTFITRTKKIFWFEGNPSWKSEEKPLITRCNIHIYPIKFTKPDFLAKMHGVRWDDAHYFIYMKEAEYLQNYYMPGGDVTFLRNSSIKYIPNK
jgi:hypothetical protein